MIPADNDRRSKNLMAEKIYSEHWGKDRGLGRRTSSTTMEPMRGSHYEPTLSTPHNLSILPNLLHRKSAGSLRSLQSCKRLLDAFLSLPNVLNLILSWQS